MGKKHENFGAEVVLGGEYVEKDTQKMPFLYIEGPKYVSFDNKTLNLEAFYHILITTIAISHFFAWEKRLL